MGCKTSQGVSGCRFAVESVGVAAVLDPDQPRIGPEFGAACFGERKDMSRKELPVESVAEAYLALLADRGVEYLFANAGTDFAPIVEAYAKTAHSGPADKGMPAPKPLIATHENLAMSMAHGYA